jgi:hypothetical protein
LRSWTGGAAATIDTAAKEGLPDRHQTGAAGAWLVSLCRQPGHGLYVTILDLPAEQAVTRQEAPD